MEAIGPGKIDLWRPGQGKRAGLAPRAVAQANRPLESEVANWDFTSVTFQGKAIGNMRDRQTKFQDRVHIVYGPVAHPLDTIDPDHLPKDGGYMECDSLQIVQIKPTGTQKPHIELEAKGNAKLEGRSFNAALTRSRSTNPKTLHPACDRKPASHHLAANDPRRRAERSFREEHAIHSVAELPSLRSDHRHSWDELNLALRYGFEMTLITILAVLPYRNPHV